MHLRPQAFCITISVAIALIVLHTQRATFRVEEFKGVQLSSHSNGSVVLGEFERDNQRQYGRVPVEAKRCGITIPAYTESWLIDRSIAPAIVIFLPMAVEYNKAILMGHKSELL